MTEPLYPVTIIRTRYGGAYEGGDWAAFNCDEWDVPSEATGCDSECEAFWRGPKAVRVGVGDTPDHALAALVALVPAASGVCHRLSRASAIVFWRPESRGPVDIPWDAGVDTTSLGGAGPATIPPDDTPP